MKVLLKNGEAQVSELPANAHILFFAQVHNFWREINYEKHPRKWLYPHTYLVIYEIKKTGEKKAFFGPLYEEMKDLGATRIYKEERKTIVSSLHGEIVSIRNSDYA